MRPLRVMGPEPQPQPSPPLRLVRPEQKRDRRRRARAGLIFTVGLLVGALGAVAVEQARIASRDTALTSARASVSRLGVLNQGLTAYRDYLHEQLREATMGQITAETALRRARGPALGDGVHVGTIVAVNARAPRIVFDAPGGSPRWTQLNVAIDPRIRLVSADGTGRPVSLDALQRIASRGALGDARILLDRGRVVTVHIPMG